MPGFHASCTRKGLGLGVKQHGFTLSPGNNLEVYFPSPDLHPHHGNPLASLESVTCRRQTPCMECIAESGLEARPYKAHSPGLSEECLHRRASQVGGRSSEFLEDGESQGGAGEEEQNSHSSLGRCQFPSFAPGASSSHLVSRARRASALLQQVRGGVMWTFGQGSESGSCKELERDQSPW